MSVRVIDARLMTSDLTRHQARAAGQGCWVVSFLPGRTLTTDQAVAALRAAEEWIAIQADAAHLGLTGLELAGLAEAECTWPPPGRGRLCGRLWKEAR